MNKVNGIELNREAVGVPALPLVLVHGAWVDNSEWRLVSAGQRAARYLSAPQRRGRPGVGPTDGKSAHRATAVSYA